ncbi:MAG: peptide-methionine (R)-S-oxide reductase MsrB [Candidatus Paceibacterota bacterium]|jgi:peptide-methionine (R)-S-oxide reductase
MKSDEELKKENPELYRIAREKGTEAPFTSKLLRAEEGGTFACAVCGQELFLSDAKFDSGTGWPSFDQAIPGSVKEISDESHGMVRTEVVCSECGAHLGHVFDDGPTSTGKRYCLNGVCLDLKSDNK